MNKQQLETALDAAYKEIGLMRIAIMRAVGRDPYGFPPPTEVLLAELANSQKMHTDRQGRTWEILERDDGSVSVYYYTIKTSATHFVVWDSLGLKRS